MTSRDDPAFSAAFTAVAATDMDVASLASATSDVPRVPRILVPVNVQALWVRPGDTIEHGAVVNPAILQAAASENDASQVDPTYPPPFTDLDARDPGIYLHWAVPDGLAQGVVSTSGEADTLHPPSDLEFAPLPNRWCVVRYWMTDPGVMTRSWVIEADRGRVVPLGSWEELDSVADDEAATARMGPADLTPISGGDATWSAVYDGVEQRLAMHDDLADLGEPTDLHYLVTGWYSDPALDPVAGASRLRGFTERLAELGWSLNARDLDRIADHLSRIDAAIAQVHGTTTLAPSEQPEGAAGTAAFHGFRPEVLTAKAAVFAKNRPFSPVQCLFHGMVRSITRLRSELDPKPDPPDVAAAVGTTSTEALSALLAESTDEQAEAAREDLLNALQYGVLAKLETPDGPFELLHEAHRRGFESQHGGFRDEQIRAGDPLANVRSRGPTPPEHLEADVKAAVDQKSRLSSAGVAFEFTSGNSLVIKEVHRRTRASETAVTGVDATAFVSIGEDTSGTDISSAPTDPPRSRADRYAVADDPVLKPRTDSGIEIHAVRRALPRVFYPQDPVVTVRGLGRSMRRRQGRLFDAEDVLRCRISGSECDLPSEFGSASTLLVEPLFEGRLPWGVGRLLTEAITLTSGKIPLVLQRYVERSAAAPDVARLDSNREAAAAALLSAEERFVNRLGDPSTQVSVLAPESSIRGTLPDPRSITDWRQAWEPIFLEWELTLGLNTDMSHWTLGEVDLHATESTEQPSFLRRMVGRSALSRGSIERLSTLVDSFIQEEETLDNAVGFTGVLSDESLEQLRKLNEHAGLGDVMHASLEGFREDLFGFSQRIEISDQDDDAQLLPTAPPELIGAGQARVTRLRVVDAFGRYVDLEPPFGFADSVEVDESPDTMAVPPRVLAPSRLWFRFVDVVDDSVDAVIDQGNPQAVRSPVAAFLLPDHVDEALEVFDASGSPLGQLRNERLGGGVVWEGAPGRPGPMGRPPFADIPDRHAAEFARAMIERDAAVRTARREAEDTDPQAESALNAFLRAVDTTLWTVDPFADSGMDYYAKLTGRPIAMVRARLLLDVVSDFDLFQADDPRYTERRAAYQHLSTVKFPVRLGALSMLDDGLLGYFVNDDYRRFHPVHASVLERAVPSGRHNGYLGSAQQASDFDPVEQSQPITHPYVIADPQIRVQTGHPVRLTLLMDPGTKVHATSGILPRKAISLPRGFVEDALLRIAPSFRFGPVLVDPSTIRLPKPSVLPADQSWTRRDSPISWKDDPIEAATQFARLPEISHEAQEGYIRVRIDPA